MSRILTASGVENDNGRLRWPLGLQIVGGPDRGLQADELRDQIDALFQRAIEQANRGPAEPAVLAQITQAVGNFRKLLTRDRQERRGLPRALYDEAERFLSQLDHAEVVLRPGVKTQLAHGVIR